MDKVKDLKIEVVTNENCNLRCSYCFAKKKESNYVMDNNTILNIFNFINNYNIEFDKLSFKIYGGESLLYPETVIKLIDSLIEYKKNNINKIVQLILITNGTLYSNLVFDKIKEARKNNIHSSLSFTVDFNKQIHNKYRKDKNGNDTFDLIVNNILKYNQEYGNNYSCQYVFNKECVEYIDDIENMQNLLKTNFYELIRTDYGYDNIDIEKTKNFFNKIFELRTSGNAYRLKWESDCNYSRNGFCGLGYAYLSFMPNGDIYPCSKAYHNNLDNLLLGNVNNKSFNYELQSIFKNMSMSPKCQTCSSGHNCLGYCFIDNFIYRKDSDNVDPWNCIVNKIYNSVRKTFE